MASSSLEVRRENQIVVATLNRAASLNALNKEIFDELERLIDVLETDKLGRALILTGAGDKAFCVGADLKERKGMNEKDILVRLNWVHALYLRIEKLPMPVIAAVNGMALGGGTELALCCDLRIASQNASFALPEVGLAIIPGTGGTQRLPRVVGVGRATEWIFTGRKIGVEEAKAAGLVNEIVGEGKALSRAVAIAESLLKQGPLALRQAKLAIQQGMDLPLKEGLGAELQAYKACLYSKDRAEGLKAFAEKREPAYRGE